MKIRGVFPDLLATLGRASSPEAGFARALRQLVTLCGATAGGLHFVPGRGAPLLITGGTRHGSALDGWLRARIGEAAGRRMRLRPVDAPPPGWRGRPPVLLRAALGEHAAPLGQFLLLGERGPSGLRAHRIPSGFPREFGLAMEQIWGLHQRTLRLEVINEVTALMATTLLFTFALGDEIISRRVNRWLFRAPDYRARTLLLGEELRHLSAESAIGTAVENGVRGTLELAGARFVHRSWRSVMCVSASTTLT